MNYKPEGGCASKVLPRGLYFSLVAATLFLCAFGTGAVSAGNLKQEIARLLETHPDIEASEESLRIANEGIREAVGAYYPEAIITADKGHEFVDSPGRREVPGEPSRLGREQAKLDVTMNVFEGFKTSANFNIAKFRKEVAELALEDVRQRVLLKGISAYIDVMRQRKLGALGLESEKNIREQLRLENELVKRGGGIEVDVLLAKTRLQRAREQSVAFDGFLNAALASYEEAFGHAPVFSDMKELGVMDSEMPKNLDGAMKIAREENPRILIAQKATYLAREEIKSTRSDFYPKVDFVTNYGHKKNADAVNGRRRDFSVVVKSTWKVFSGFITKAKARAATYSASEKQKLVLLEARLAREAVRTAWARYKTAKTRVRLLENAVILAEEVFDARRKLRDAGKEETINVLDAEGEIFNAQINLINADADAKLAVYQIMAGIGRLRPGLFGVNVLKPALDDPLIPAIFLN